MSCSALAFSLGVASAAATDAAEAWRLQWDRLPPLPPSAGQAKQPGVAGPFAGVHGDALIVAGGANFPDKLPWDGGAKVWWDDIWVLEKLSSGAPQWVRDRSFRLPRRIGYGISVDTPKGVLCAGGHDAERCYADVFLLAWDAAARTVRRTELPAMPQPLTFMAGALVGDTLFVAGGQTTMKNAAPTKIFWALDLAPLRGGAEPRAWRWRELPAWPGPVRVLPVAAAQRGAKGAEFFLFSGRMPRAGKPTEILSDAYAFDPATETWRTLPAIGDGARSGLSVMAGTAAAVGDRDIVFFGGDRGDLFFELEQHDLAIAQLRAQLAEADADARSVRDDINRRIDARLATKRKIYDTHPGFARDVLAFDTRANAWRAIGQSPFPSQVTTLAVRHGNALLIPTGEIKPGIRTPDLVRVQVSPAPAARITK